MGKSCSKTTNKPENKGNYVVRTSAKQTTLHKQIKESEKVTFKVSLENLKAKNLSHTDIHILFNFAQLYRTFTIFPLAKSENPHFKFSEDFEFEASRTNLKSQFAIFTIRDQEKKDLVSIRLNLYELAVGPFHHDMILQNKNSNFKGRLLFDLKMKQKTLFFVKPVYIHAMLQDSLKEKAYNFYLRIITSEGELNSDHSENIFNQFYMGKGEKIPFEEIQEENENYELTMNEMTDQQNQRSCLFRFLPTNEKKGDKPGKSHPFLKKNTSRIRTKSKSPPESPHLAKNISSVSVSSSKIKFRSQTLNEKHKKELIWNYKDPLRKDFPSLDADIFVTEFSLNSLHFCLWGTNNPEEHSNNYSEEESISKKDEPDGDHLRNRSIDIHFVDLRLIAECYWSFNKLFREDFHAYETNENEEYVISNNIKVFTEKLWNHGAVVGEIEAHFHVELRPFMRQMMGGVRTETGIKELSSLISQNHKILENLNYSSKLKAFFSNKESLIISVLKLLDQSNKNKSSVKEKFQNEVFQNIKKLKELLTVDASIVYKDEEELLQSQTIFIELANHILNYADEMDEKIRELYYDILKIICNREELNLHSMGFDQSTYEYLLSIGSKMSFQKGEGRNKNQIKYLALKMKVGLSYQNFLYHALIKVLSKFEQKALNENERNFTENFCGLAYFRIPEFRMHFLENFIEKAKNQEHLFEVYVVDQKQKPIGLGIYDWEKNFHKFIKTSQKGVKHLQDFQKSLEEFDFKTEIVKNDGLFFSIMSEWCRSVYIHKVSKYHIPWNEIPGYGVLINALLLEMKNKSVSHYDKNLKEATKFALLNEKLLGIFIVIIYKNTRVYDSVATFHTFELIDSWMEFLQKEKKNIHTIFDYSFFFKGIKMVMEQEHAICIAKCINMIYNNYQLFPPAFKKEICQYLFSSMFFKFFMHWHTGVRFVFHHFLIYRIHHLHRNMKTELKNIGELHMELMKPHDYQAKNHLINDVIFVWYSKMIKILEDAKDRLEIDGDLPFYDTEPLDSLRNKLMKYKKGDDAKKADFIKKYKEKASPFNSFNVGKKSIVFENSILESERETIKSALFRKKDEVESKSLSYIVDIEKEREVYSRKESKDSDLDGAGSKTLNNLQKESDVSPLKFSKKGKIYINRRNIFFDKDEEKYLQIPQEYMKYLPQAFMEFEKLKKKYWEWFITQKGKLSKLNEEEMKKALFARSVPTVKIKFMVDEMERSEEEVKEW